MLITTGIDIIEIERIEKAIKRAGQKFIERVFTDTEITYCSAQKHPLQHYAARFAAKEAVYKTLKQSPGSPLRWREIEIINDPGVQPEIRLNGTTKSLGEKLGIVSISISLTHSKQFAAAAALTLYHS